MYQNNLNQKISRAQAVLEQTGELTLVKDDQQIEILQVEFEGATGWKVGNQIHPDPAQAIAAARREIGDTIGNQIQGIARVSLQLGTSVLSAGLAKLAIACVTGSERLNSIR